MLINFEGIQAHNFGPYENFIFNFTQGTTLLLGKTDAQGFDSNGAGKSHIYEAISWCLYGKTLKGQGESAMVGMHDVKCSVSLFGNIQGASWNVRRERDGNRVRRLEFNLMTDRHHSKDLSTPTLTQKAIEDTFGDFSAFTASTIFGQRALRLVTAPIERKRKVMSSLCGFDSFDAAKKLADEKRNAWDQKFMKISPELAGLRGSVTIQSKKLDLDTPLQKIEADIREKFQCGIDTAEQVLDQLLLREEEVQSTFRKYSTDSWQVEEKIRMATSQRDKYSVSYARVQSALNVCCPECGQRIDKEFIWSRMQELENDIRGLCTLRPAPPQCKSLASVIDDLRGLIREWKRIHGLKDNELILEQDIVMGNLQKIKRIQELAKEKAEVEQQIEIHRKWSRWFGSEMKNMLLAEMEGPINHFANIILSDLTGKQFRVNVAAGVDGMNIEVYKDGNKVDYNSLSDGEQKRIDICIAVGTQKAITTCNEIQYSFVFYDEIFDGLDESGIELVVNCKELFDPGKSTVMISHNQRLQGIFEREVWAVKENNKSRLEVA